MIVPFSCLGDVIFYLGSNPGRILKTLRPGFKRRSEDRDAILDEPEFRQLERQIRKMMRSDSQAAWFYSANFDRL